MLAQWNSLKTTLPKAFSCSRHNNNNLVPKFYYTTSVYPWPLWYTSNLKRIFHQKSTKISQCKKHLTLLCFLHQNLEHYSEIPICSHCFKHEVLKLCCPVQGCCHKCALHSVVYHWLTSGLRLSACHCLGQVVVRRLIMDFDTVKHFYVCTVN